MKSDGFNPETLAKLAAQLNPQLACDDPAKAIELARNLLIAANPELAEEEALRAEGERLHEEGKREDKLFPGNECISVAEAFKASPGQYKTETGFAAALKKEKLTTVLQDVNLPQWGKALPHEEKKFVKRSEVTSLKAVQELFRRQRKATKSASESEKKPRQRKKIRKMSRNSKGKKRNKSAEKRNPKTKKRKRQSKKRKPQKARKAS